MDECIFCKIAKNEIESFKIYEDNSFLAFLDINPYAEGHTLVIPKKHFRWVWDVDNIEEYMSVCKKIAKYMKKVTSKDLIYSLVIGKEIPHAHIHLIPNTDRGFEEKVNKFIQISTTKADQNKLKEIVKKYKVN